jgi:hypothetical protein
MLDEQLLYATDFKQSDGTELLDFVCNYDVK